MTLRERLQGEWLCCVDEQRVDEAWSISIRGDQCDFEGARGTLRFEKDLARLDLRDGDFLVINRQWAMEPLKADGAIPIAIENGRGLLHSGWMFRAGLSNVDEV